MNGHFVDIRSTAGYDPNRPREVRFSMIRGVHHGTLIIKSIFFFGIYFKINDYFQPPNRGSAVWVPAEFRTQADVEKMEKIQNDYMDYLKASGIQLRVVFRYIIP